MRENYDLHEDENLSNLFRTADEMFRSGKFGDFDKLLNEVDMKTVSTTMLIGWLTMAAQPKRVEGREMLPSRPAFLKRARAEIELRENGDKKRIRGLLMGLED
jgi:hypothetical protein